MKKSILHKPMVDDELYKQDLHIHTKMTVFADPLDLSSDTYLGSYDANIDPFDFLIMLSNMKNGQRKQIKKIAFVDHDTLMPFDIQEDLREYQNGLDLDIHFGIEIAAKVHYTNKGAEMDKKWKHVHLIVYDLAANKEDKIFSFLEKLERQRIALLKYIFNEFCDYHGLYIITPEELSLRVENRMQGQINEKNVIKKAERIIRFKKMMEKVSEEELNQMNEWKIRKLIKGTDIYGSILRFADAIKRHPKNFEFFWKRKDFKNGQDIVNVILNSFKERIEEGFVESSDIIRFSKETDGVVVLAHPGKTKVSDKAIEQLIHQGLDGIEVFHPDNGKRIRDLLRIAKDRRLGITIGTDFHGSKNRDKCLSNYEHLIRKLKGMIGRAKRYNNEGRKTPNKYDNERVRIAHKKIIKKNKR
ncbi:hypothetical protein J7J26_02220 [Candidatus Micrarchaeota archaeon]|nr:hypothetical protein [Candidatus Micrarchaeota archaeon]